MSRKLLLQLSLLKRPDQAALKKMTFSFATFWEYLQPNLEIITNASMTPKALCLLVRSSSNEC